MNIAKTACAGALLLAANMASASGFAIQMTDFALPGQASTYGLLGACNDFGGQYVPVHLCYSDGPAFTLTTLESTDKTLRLKVTDIQAVTGVAVDYDYFVTFKEAGANPSEADDVLRVQFHVLDISAGTLFDGTPLSEAELTLSLISDALVPDYLAGIRGTSTDKGQFVNGINQAVPLLKGGYGFADEFGPLDVVRGLPLDGLFVSPTAVAEPGSLATLAMAGLAFAAVTGLARRQRRVSAGIDRSANSAPQSA